MWVMREEEIAFKSSNLSVDEVELFNGNENRFEATLIFINQIYLKTVKVNLNKVRNTKLFVAK